MDSWIDGGGAGEFVAGGGIAMGDHRLDCQGCESHHKPCKVLEARLVLIVVRRLMGCFFFRPGCGIARRVGPMRQAVGLQRK
jgi:hypothetical protein